MVLEIVPFIDDKEMNLLIKIFLSLGTLVIILSSLFKGTAFIRSFLGGRVFCTLEITYATFQYLFLSFL